MHKIITLKPNLIIEEKEVEEITLEVLHKEVQGDVEYVGFVSELTENEIAMFINENGKHIKLETTAVFAREVDGKILIADYLAGNALFVNMSTGEETGLTPKQIKIVKDVLNTPMLFNENMVSILKI